jgi:hypothetical protein
MAGPAAVRKHRTPRSSTRAHGIDMAGDQDLRPAATVSDGLGIGKDIEAAFSSSRYRYSLDVIALSPQIFLKPFCALNLIIRDGWYVDKILVELI